MNTNKNKSFLLFFIIFLTGSLVGSIVSFTFRENFENKLLKNRIVADKIDWENTGTGNLNLLKFHKTYNFIKNNYYDVQNITNEKLLDSSISGLVKGLGDKHSDYLNKDDNSNFKESLDQEFEGIGAVVGLHNKGIELDMILKGSPAKKYGLLKGDIIISANGIKLAGLPLKEAISHIKGPAGTQVELEIFRFGEKELLTKQVTRNKVKIPSVESEILEGNLGYIALATFGDKTYDEFIKALIELKDTDGLILDVRGNGGGYLEVAVKILSNFIGNGKNLVITKGKGEKIEQVLKSINTGNIYKGKIVVLINENSASASEITAGALRDYDKAILVGKKSYGKGSVQVPFDLGDGSMVKLTIAKWFTPLDKNIDGEGISPDIKIDFEKSDYDLEECKKIGKCEENMKKEDFKGYDRQKEEAIKILKKFIEKNALQLTVDEYKEGSN